MVAEVANAEGLAVTPAVVDAVAAQGMANLAKIRAPERPLHPRELPEMPVVDAGNVARYVAELRHKVKASDIVSIVVPPFRRMFVEAQGVPSDLELLSWGADISISHDRTNPSPFDPKDAWVIHLMFYGEWQKDKPVGPIGRYVIPLDTSGRFTDEETDSHGGLFGGPVDVGEMDDEAREAFHQRLLRHLTTTLLAVSFMHCKNVDITPVDSPPLLSKKHERERGVPLSRYYVLTIEPMRQTLNRDGGAGESGLRQALHICRGHFKTFTDDAPLFGRYTGTYWWSDYVRGDAAQGAVTKDYRIRIEESGLGRAFEPLDEHVELEFAEEHTGRDPDLGGRGLRAHNATLNALAHAVAAAGYVPRCPKPEEPQYDLAWDDGSAIWVAEVKSLTPTNEERQLRLALGQVLRYRQLLDAGSRPVETMIAVERCPSDDRWLDLCAQSGVVLVWRGYFKDALTRQPTNYSK